jgi:HK97 family phage major capsid protein
MARRRAADVQADIDRIRAELVELDSAEEPTEEQVARSQSALDEYDGFAAEHAAAVEYETRMEAVRSAAGRQADTETAARSGSYLGRGPEVQRRTDPYEGPEMLRAGVIPGRDMISRARAAVEQAPRHVDDAGREHLTRLLECDDSRQTPLIARHMLMTGSSEYHEAFRAYVESRGTYHPEALRAALSLTDANGGYLVPFTLDPTIILTNAGVVDPIRSISRVVQIATDSWNGVSSAGVTAEWTAEGAEAADASPTFVQPSITPKKADAWIFGSYEALADTGFATQLGPLLADAKARLEGAAFATGNTGATKPRGVVAAVAAVTASIVAAASTNAFVIGDVYSVSEAVPARYAAASRWIGNKKIYNKVRQFDTSGGGGFWTNLGMSVPNELLGQPRFECSTMESAVTTGGNILLVGDFEQYVVVDRVGMSVLYDPMVKSTGNGRPTGQAGWYAFWRVGADVTDANAFRLLQLNAVAAATALA